MNRPNIFNKDSCIIGVHRYLWRNMKTDKPPDVYVKTVLTFGDKPVHAMVQIALRKTAEEGENEYPEAAKVLKVNTYMDDICHSEAGDASQGTTNSQRSRQSVTERSIPCEEMNNKRESKGRIRRRIRFV